MESYIRRSIINILSIYRQNTKNKNSLILKSEHSFQYLYWKTELKIVSKESNLIIYCITAERFNILPLTAI